MNGGVYASDDDAMPVKPIIVQKEINIQNSVSSNHLSNTEKWRQHKKLLVHPTLYDVVMDDKEIVGDYLL